MASQENVETRGESPLPAIRIVAIGASAGGLQALKPLVGALQANGSASFVVAHHLSPHHQSILADLLAAACALTVRTAENGQPLQADHVYVCPQAHHIEIVSGTVVLTALADAALISPSVDRLFTSLASDAGEKAIAVVLSGSGQDGSKGAEAINAAAGTVLVQSPDEAVQPSMPEAVIAAGAADLTGSIEQIAAWLNDPERLETAMNPQAGNSSAQLFAELLAHISKETGLDLSQYKENTLRRQTVRRYRSLGFASLDEYWAHVASDPEEPHLLKQSFLISVSSFFRDPPVFDCLARALRQLVSGKQPGESIRIWVPGCATGEEAYSIAILLAEILGERLRKFDVRIFATDIDHEALEFARAGVYSNELAKAIDSERRRQWLTAAGNHWRIAKEVRELCVFSAHDVISHPPFIKMDLISCRNLLIYFKAKQQSDLIAIFHYGLNPHGLLLLGKSESAGFHSQDFEPVDAGHKLYRRRNNAGSQAYRLARPSSPFVINRSYLSKPSVPPHRQTLIDATLATIARKYGPPGVLVNAAFEPLHFFGRSQRYFALSEESVDFSVFALCVPELRSELKALCYRLIQDNLPALDGASHRVALKGSAESIGVRPRLRRINAGNDGDFALLISFEEAALADGAAAEHHIPAHRRLTSDLSSQFFMWQT